MSDLRRDVDLTALNFMGSRDFDAAVEQFARWGLRWMDVRGEVYGKSIAELDHETTSRAATALQRAGLRTYCLSTRIFDDHAERGQDAVRTEHPAALDRA